MWLHQLNENLHYVSSIIAFQTSSQRLVWKGSGEYYGLKNHSACDSSSFNTEEKDRLECNKQNIPTLKRQSFSKAQEWMWTWSKIKGRSTPYNVLPILCRVYCALAFTSLHVSNAKRTVMGNSVGGTHAQRVNRSSASTPWGRAVSLCLILFHAPVSNPSGYRFMWRQKRQVLLRGAVNNALIVCIFSASHGCDISLSTDYSAPSRVHQLSASSVLFKCSGTYHSLFRKLHWKIMLPFFFCLKGLECKFYVFWP